MDDSLMFQFEPAQREGLFGSSISMTQALVGGFGVLEVIGTLIFVSTPGAFFTALLLAAFLIALAAIPYNGIPLVENAPLAWRTLLRPRHRTPINMARGVRLAVDDLDGAPDPGDPELPDSIAGDLRFISARFGDTLIGVAHDRTNNTYSCALQCTATGFNYLDDREQEQRLAMWGGVQAQCAREGSPVHRLQWIERTMPTNSDELAEYFNQYRDTSLGYDEQSVDSYLQLIHASRGTTREHELFLVIQIHGGRSRKEIQRYAGGDGKMGRDRRDLGACRLLVAEADGIIETLQDAGIRVGGYTKKSTYQKLVRLAYDPFARTMLNRMSIDNPAIDGVSEQDAWPTAEEVTWDFYRTDSAYHCTAIITGWPEEMVGPTFMRPFILGADQLRTISLTMEPIAPTRSKNEIKFALSSDVASDIDREKSGKLKDQWQMQRSASLNQRAYELAHGHQEVRFVGHVTVSAPDEASLIQAYAELRRRAQMSSLVLRQMRGEQDVGFTYTLPLARGLR